MNSEFFDVNAQGELIGFDGKISKVRYPSKGSRREFEKHFPEVPHAIRQQLGTGKLRLGDSIIYSVKPVAASKTIKMFETQDVKETGICNISNAKLPKNATMLVSGIYLLQGQANAAVPGSPTEDEIKSIRFTTLSLVGALANGEFSFKANKVSIVPDNTQLRYFCTDNNHNLPLGYYNLDNPRLVTDDVLIEFTLELGTTLAIPQDTYLFVGLEGTITTP